MSKATEEGKQALATFVLGLICQSPPLTHLGMMESEFDSNGIAAILDALINGNITTLVSIDLDYNPTYFKTESKCVTWAAVFKKQPGLSSLELADCNVEASNQEVLQLACPEGCWINFGS